MIRLLNSSLAVRRSVVIAILTAITGAVCLVMAVAGTGLYQSHAAIEEKRRLLGRLEAVSEQLPLAMRAAPAGGGPNDGFLNGDSEPVIRATMQQQFQSIAAAQGLGVMSVGKAPDFVRNDVTYAGLQANVSGSVASMHRTLMALEMAQPMLFVTHLTVRSPDGLSKRQPVAEPVLVAQLRIYGALRPDVAPAGLEAK